MENLNLPPFYVGQKIVCNQDFTVKSEFDSVFGIGAFDKEFPGGIPIKGCVYTVRNCQKYKTWGVRLNEIINPITSFGKIPNEPVYGAKFFSPVEEQKYPAMTFAEIKKKEEKEVLILN